MEIYDGNICLTAGEISEIIPYATIRSLLCRNQAKRVQRGCRGKQALYSVDDFKKEYRAMLYEHFPELSSENRRTELTEQYNVVLEQILPDPNARYFFDTCRTPSGRLLASDESAVYYNNAIILNGMRRVWYRMHSARAKQGRRMVSKDEFWKMMSGNLAYISDRYANSLQGSSRRLQQQAEKYYAQSGEEQDNYASLLKSGRYGNRNRARVTPQVERLLISIYAAKDKPFMSDVQKQYGRFLLGQVDIVDYETGEVYDRNDFYRDGEPVFISEATVWNVLNKPVNRRIADRYRNDFKYNQRHDVYVRRESPYCSLSKISLDDRDLCRKTTAGEWVHAYYAYDVASGCVIGAAYSLKKDVRLVMECMRDMWRNLRRWNLPTPYEAEVENHLMKELSSRLDNTFMEVTWCQPMNSREKRAEHKNKQKKYYGPTSEKSQGMAHGRHYAKQEAYLFSREKIFDENNHNYKPVLSPDSFEAIVAEDRAQIELYNNARHTNPDKREEFEDMTRMQVLVMHPHPKLAPLNWRALCREWGCEAETSLKASSLLTVQHCEWVTSRPDVVDLFKPNNYECTAYYIPGAGGKIEEIYLYQDGVYIDNCLPYGRFQEAVLERTEKDTEIMQRQLGRKQSYRKMIRDAAESKIEKVKILNAETTLRAIESADRDDMLPDRPDLAENDQAPVPDTEYSFMDMDYYAASAVNSL